MTETPEPSISMPESVRTITRVLIDSSRNIRDRINNIGTYARKFEVLLSTLLADHAELALLKDMQVTAAEMLEAAGATNIRTHDSNNPPGHCIHEMGTARMGRDPKTSVTNAHNQLWDVRNVFVTDGACMASSANQNPSITYMALTARAAAYAVDAMKRNEL